jgi:acetyltransferase-like isoleucine patch superfamily enzyme
VTFGLTRWLALRRCDSVGRGVVLVGNPYVDNRGHLHLGEEVTLVSQPVRSHLVTGRGGTLRLGQGVHVGHGASLSSHGEVSIGAGTKLGPFVTILDTDFHTAGNHAQAPEPRPVVIGDGVVLGARVTVLPGARIGDAARIQAGSVVSGEVPAGAVAAGVPARVGGLRGPAGPEEDVAQRVLKVAQLVFALGSAPELAWGPAQIPAWDSLGSLRLLLALEDAFGSSVSQDQMANVRTLADVASLLRRQRGCG